MFYIEGKKLIKIIDKITKIYYIIFNKRVKFYFKINFFCKFRQSGWNICLNIPKYVNNEFGDKKRKMHIEILLKQKRKEKNITLAQLSERTGISTTHLNDIENNLKEPSISMMVRLAKGLDLKMEELYKVIW